MGSEMCIRDRIDTDVEHGASWIVRAHFYDSNGKRVGLKNTAAGSLNGDPTTAWQQVGGRLTVPSTATQMDIRLFAYHMSGWIAYDDVSLVKVGTTTNLVTNPSFESGTTGWRTYKSSDFPATGSFASASMMEAASTSATRTSKLDMARHFQPTGNSLAGRSRRQPTQQRRGLTCTCTTRRVGLPMMTFR